MKKVISIVLVILVIISCSTIGALADSNNSKTRYSVLILDTSGSMSGTPSKVQKTAAKKFCEALLSADGKSYISIVRLNSSSSIVCDFTDDIDVLNTAIDTIVSYGGTNIGQALQTADSLLDAVENKPYLVKNIILCSDGLPEAGNKSSSGPYRDKSDSIFYQYANYAYNISNTIKDKGTLIYTLGFFHSLSGNDLIFGRRFLNDLQNAGYYEVDDPNELEFKFGEIANDVSSNEYTVLGETFQSRFKVFCAKMGFYAVQSRARPFDDDNVKCGIFSK